MARMQIKAGNVESNDLDKIKSDAGTAALKNLMENVLTFYSLNNQFNSVKESINSVKDTITTLMSNLDLDVIEHKGLRCKLAKRTNTNIDEEGILEFCKTLNIDGLVKTKEYVDMDVLENLLYQKQLDSALVEKYIIKTESQYPKLSGKLKENM